MIRDIIFPIIKIVVHKTEHQEIVWIFTGVCTPAGEYVMFNVSCPLGEGEKWVQQQLRTTSYEVVLDGFEICSPF